MRPPRILHLLSTAREEDSESNLMHYRARSYDSRLGRFSQQDPASDHIAGSHYAYVAGAPVARRDASGYRWTDRRAHEQDLETDQAVIKRLMRPLLGWKTRELYQELNTTERIAARGGAAEGFGLAVRKFVSDDNKEHWIHIRDWLPIVRAEIAVRVALRDSTLRHEGYRTKMYKDSKGIPTIGVGFNLTREDAPAIIKGLGLDYDKVKAGAVELTKQQVESLLDDDLDSSWQAGRRILPNFLEMPGTARRLVAEMVFQMGEEGVRKKFPKFQVALRARNWSAAADEMQNSKWHREDSPERAKEMTAEMRGITEK